MFTPSLADAAAMFATIPNAREMFQAQIEILLIENGVQSATYTVGGAMIRSADESPRKATATHHLQSPAEIAATIVAAMFGADDAEEINRHARRI